MSCIKVKERDFLGGPVAKMPRSQYRRTGFDPWLGNVPQLRVHMPQIKTPRAATKTWCSQTEGKKEKRK